MDKIPDSDRRKQGKSPKRGPRAVQPGDTPPWQELLITGDGVIIGPITESSPAPVPCLYNAVHALSKSPDWSSKLAYDACVGVTILNAAPPWGQNVETWEPREWTDDDDVATAAWMQKECRMLISDVMVSKAVENVARKNPFNPVQDYLRSLTWDCEARLDTWLSVYFGVDHSEIVSAFGSHFLIAAVARAFNPGCKMDTCLFLEGAQGKRKSTALKVLAGDRFFTDEVPDIRDKDAAIQLRGKWIVELGEASAIQNVSIAKINQFLARSVDRYRPPFGRRAIDVPRGCVFAGTVNASSYLKDATGGRRFWPVETNDIWIDGLYEDRDQLWAEAVECYHHKPCWWLDTLRLNQLAKIEQAKRYVFDAWHETIADWLEGVEDTSVDEVLEGALKKKVRDYEVDDPGRVGKILQFLGWNQYQPVVDGKRPRRYSKPVIVPIED